ncbi:TonB-dependent receptor [Sphingomonas hengshuiensis]|uniref:TonB-dependent receptor n=1 Tax=Sphingomonas hengshuiensis TaxID=1609977 RepID=A0A7U4J6D5_9SPHN|nr:TonB-dependent receptor [Sphingomonas hengshuiensis]AJP71081.1 TonB-dependent receptor [Sphingomonas hengshuiensis]
MSIRTALLALVSPLALVAAPAFAQQATPPSDAEPDGEIVVTAQLREQSATEVPFALTAYNGQFLDDLGITEFDRLGQFVPGFDVQNQSPNNPGFVMRGITSDSGAAYSEPRVSVFQDGVSISKSRGSYVELFDMERVEIAKGPQSTLYGRGALIGAVNLIQAKADPTHGYGYVYGQYGNYNGYRIDQTVNLPLSDDLAVRVASRFKERDGFVDNLLGGDDYNGIKSEAVRGSLRWAPGALTFDLIGNYQHDRATGTAFKSIAYNPTDPTTGVVIGDRGRTSGAALVPGANFEHSKPLGLDRDVWGVTGIANYALSETLSLNAIGSYREFAGIEIFDADGISLPVLTAAEDAQGDQTMGTLRLTYANDRLTAFVGGTYFRENGFQRTPGQFDERVTLARLTNTLNGGGAIPGRAATDPAPLALFSNTAYTGQLLQGVAAAYGVALPTAQAQAIAANLKSNHLETNTNSARTKSWDLFADATYKLTDRLEVGGGIRWSHDDKTTGFQSAMVNGRSILGGFVAALGQPAATRTALLGALAVPGAANIPTSALYPVPLFGLGLQPTGTNGQLYSQDHTDDGITWRATARYELASDASLYATYARGRRPEILNVSAPSAPGGAALFNILPAETVDSYETGVKAALLDRTLFVDGSVFYYRYSNFQTTEQQGTTFVTINAGRARSYGFEGQFRWNAADWVSLFGNYAYNHSRFMTGARDGNRFRLSPDHSAALGMLLKAPVGPVKIDFTPSVTWQSSVFFDEDNDLPALQAANLIPDTVQDEKQGSYALVDARLGFETENGRWRVEAFATNLFDRDYIKDAGNAGDSLGLPTFIAGEPRMYGLALSLKIGKR